jgi:hypothetical protein
MSKVQDALKKIEGFLMELVKQEKPEPEAEVEQPVEMAEEAEEVAEEQPAEEEAPEEEGADKDKSIADLVDLSQNGAYTIEVYVEDGKISYGAVYSSTYKELQLSQHTSFSSQLDEVKQAYEAQLSAQKADFDKKLEEIGKESGSNPVIQAPVETKEPVKLSKKDLLRQSILNS